MILLDTSFLIDYFRGVEATKTLIEDDVVVTAITFHELLAGVKQKKAAKEERFFRRFFSLIKILQFDASAAEESSSIAAKLAAIGKTVNTLDIIIAGIAVTNGITTIVTKDQDFHQIATVTDLQILTY